MSEDFLHYLSGRAERLIRQAQDEGAFDDLPGKGKPLALADDSAVPEELRMAYAVLKNAGYVPPEIADRKEINSLLDLLESCDDGAETWSQVLVGFRQRTRHQHCHEDRGDGFQCSHEHRAEDGDSLGLRA